MLTFENVLTTVPDAFTSVGDGVRRLQETVSSAGSGTTGQRDLIPGFWAGAAAAQASSFLTGVATNVTTLSTTMTPVPGALDVLAAGLSKAKQLAIRAQEIAAEAPAVTIAPDGTVTGPTLNPLTPPGTRVRTAMRVNAVGLLTRLAILTANMADVAATAVLTTSSFLLDGLRDALAEVLRSIAPAIGEILRSMGEVVDEVLTKLAPALNELLDDLGKAAGEIVRAAGEAAASTLEGVGLPAAGAAVRGATEAAAAATETALDKAGDATAKALENAGDVSKRALDSAAEKAEDALGDAANRVESGRAKWTRASGNPPTPDDIHLTDKRKEHIFDGDKHNPNGGGHAPNSRRPNKTLFPSRWDEAETIEHIHDVARNPDSPPILQKNGNYKILGTRDGVEILVVVKPDGSIHTAYPTHGDGVMKNDKNGVPHPKP